MLGDKWLVGHGLQCAAYLLGSSSPLVRPLTTARFCSGLCFQVRTLSRFLKLLLTRGRPVEEEEEGTVSLSIVFIALNWTLRVTCWFLQGVYATVRLI